MIKYPNESEGLRPNVLFQNVGKKKQGYGGGDRAVAMVSYGQYPPAASLFICAMVGPAVALSCWRLTCRALHALLTF